VLGKDAPRSSRSPGLQLSEAGSGGHQRAGAPDEFDRFPLDAARWMGPDRHAASIE
jgi:hypothetical protein